jgi:hypothetical protein
MSIATLCLFITWPYGLLSWLWGGAFAKTLEANRLFGEKQFAQAVTRYRDALVDAPAEETLHYNLGTALYEQKLYDKAVEELEKAAGVDDPLQAARVHYNLGNCRFRQAEEALRTNQAEEYGKLLLQAIESYTRSLEFNPHDQDAKFNLELARKRYLERPKPPKQQQNQQNQKQQDQQQQQNQQQQNQQKQNPQQSKEQRAQAAQQQKGNAKKQSEKGEKKQAVMMSPEEAQRLLDSLEEEEKNAKKQLLQAPMGGQRYVEKDW